MGHPQSGFGAVAAAGITIAAARHVGFTVAPTRGKFGGAIVRLQFMRDHSTPMTYVSMITCRVFE